MATSIWPAAMARMFVFQRSQVERANPSDRRARIRPCAARLEPGHQAGVRLAVFLQTRRSVARRCTFSSIIASTSRQVFGSPTLNVGCRPNSLSTATGFGPARDRGDVGDRLQQASAIDVPFDFGQQVSHAHAGHEDDHVDLAGEHAVRKVDRLAILFDRHLAHRGADARHAAETLDERGHFGRSTTLERGHAQAAEARSGFWHASP